MIITALYVILGIVLLFALLLSLRIGICIMYSEDLTVYLKILFIKIRLFPKKEKKYRPSRSDKKKGKGDATSDSRVKKKTVSHENKAPLSETLKTITEIVSTFARTFAKHLHVRLARIHVCVASGDAAQTAILYGAISGACACLIDALDSITNLDGMRRSSINIYADFLSEKCKADISITLSISVFGALATLSKTLFRYIRSRSEKEYKTERNNENGN